MYPDVQGLALMAHHLVKPLRYFIVPNLSIPELGEISREEEQLLMLFRQIDDPQQRRIIIAQMRAIAELFEVNPNSSDSRIS